MDKIAQLTADGSHTIIIPAKSLSYHSRFGAIQESKHVFIRAGLEYLYSSLSPVPAIHILEIGFGTGLNALLTMQWGLEKRQNILYTTLETNPLQIEAYQVLNYPQQLNIEAKFFHEIHRSEWEKFVSIHPLFMLCKLDCSLLHFVPTDQYHLIYFDAFAPDAQPELWTNEIFERMYSCLVPGGVLATYCSKGNVRRALLTAGFNVEKIPGPPGKREMLRAWKSG